jgi:tRNA pseudouridine32 synthase / 23S rRNA pseudouridine746 synthase
MQMLTVAGAPNAHTRVELITCLSRSSDAPALAHYRLTPLTGRKHQLRAHLSELGLPIVGDRIYPKLWPEPAVNVASDYTQPLQLLARELAFTDPITHQLRRFTSPRRLELTESRPPL